MPPDFFYEKSLLAQSFKIIAGVDEVGRGCLAGPVVAGAVVFNPQSEVNPAINDSKLLAATKRVELLDTILENCLSWGLGIATVEEINEMGIVPATALAMKRAVEDMGGIDHILIDGLDSKYYSVFSPTRHTCIIKGDQQSYSIAAASILAKTFRDSLMRKAHLQENRYDWDHNKGYGTKKHREALKLYGATEFHRRLFIRSCL